MRGGDRRCIGEMEASNGDEMNEVSRSWTE